MLMSARDKLYTPECSKGGNVALLLLFSPIAVFTVSRNRLLIIRRITRAVVRAGDAGVTCRIASSIMLTPLAILVCNAMK